MVTRHFYKNRPKLSVIAGAMLLLLSLLASPLGAGSEDEAIAFYNQLYDKALKYLQNGGPWQQVRAARIIGGQKSARFIRPLGDALIKGLDQPATRQLPENDPFVKSQIAWALGRVGHRWSIPPLLKGLNITIQVIDQERTTRADLRQKSARDKNDRIVLDITKPGPAMMGEGYLFPASPDSYWSVSDDFKSSISINRENEADQLRLMGYNYINLALQILQSLEIVGLENSIYFRSLSPTEESKQVLENTYATLEPLMKHPISSIRSASASTLGGFGTLRSLSILEQSFQNEKDDAVRVRIARAILINDKTRFDRYEFSLSRLKVYDDDVRVEAILALKELAMGESIFALRAALEAEAEPSMRQLLKEAIQAAELDNVTPINY